MRAGPYTGLSQYQLNPQYPSPVQGGQAQLSHTVPQRHSSALWGQSISSDWCLLAFSIEITCESLVYPAEGKGSCAGAPHPKQTPHLSHACLMRLGKHSSRCQLGWFLQLLTLAKSMSGLMSETAPQTRGEVLTQWAVLCSAALGCRINRQERRRKENIVLVVFGFSAWPLGVWASAASVYFGSSCGWSALLKNAPLLSSLKWWGSIKIPLFLLLSSL